MGRVQILARRFSDQKLLKVGISHYYRVSKITHNPSNMLVEMFTDQIPHMPRHCNEYIPAAKPLLTKTFPLVPTADDLTEGWGLSFSLSHTKSPTGSAVGSASWSGIANLFWFADRQNGIGGMVASQILPFGGRYGIQVLVCGWRLISSWCRCRGHGLFGARGEDYI